MHPFAREHLKRKTNSISGMPGKELDSSLIQLNQNLNYFVGNKYFKYPSDYNEEISDLYIRFLKLENPSSTDLSFLKPENLLFVASSTAIDLLIRAFCEPSVDQVGICSPTFPLYSYCASNNNIEVVDIRLVGESFDQLDREEILCRSNLKLLFIPAPNNPIGTMPNRESMIHLLRNHQGIIGVDEAYIEFAEDSSFVSEINRFSNLAILRSFSKAWGLAGIRCGVVIANSELIQTIQQLLPPCFFPSAVQDILREVLLSPDHIFKTRQIVAEERKYLVDKIVKLPITQKVYPSQSNFIAVTFFDGNRVHRSLVERGILVKNLAPVLPNTLRISLGDIKANRYLIEILEGIC